MKIGWPSPQALPAPMRSNASAIRFQGTDTVYFGNTENKKPVSTWDPAQYLKFEAPRLRPALDLLARIPLENPGTVYDLGCGTGNITGYLRQRWPQARITGLDSSAEMLAKARKDHPGVAFKKADVGNWKAGRGKADLIYSNATLHWLPDHQALFPRLMKNLKPGGVLAVQMPRNFDAPSHRLIREVAENGPWAEALKPVLRDTPVMTPADYHGILAPHAGKLDIWETEYLQVLEGENPVAEFTKGTWLKPLLDALDEPMKSAFEREYRRRVLEAYPPGPDGKTLFPFRRLFMLATAPQ